MAKLTLNDLLDSPDFSGIVISKNLIEKLEIKKHPFVRMLIENEINKTANISGNMNACVIHEDGWGFISIN